MPQPFDLNGPTHLMERQMPEDHDPGGDGRGGCGGDYDGRGHDDDHDHGDSTSLPWS